MEFPICPKCSKQRLMVPLSDFGIGGAHVQYKAWVCVDSECGYNIRVDRGEISYQERVGEHYKDLNRSRRDD
jgi:hypothetical protein